MAKPTNCVYPKCFDCPYEDCVRDSNRVATEKDIERIKAYHQTERYKQKHNAYMKAYRQTEQGKESSRKSNKKYRFTDKYEDWRKEYRSREDIREKERAYAREYYYRKKAERLNARLQTAQ